MSSEEDRLKEEEMASEGDSIGFKVPSLPSSPAGFKLPAPPATQVPEKAPSRAEETINQDSADEAETENKPVDKNATNSAVTSTKVSIPAVPLAYEEPSWGGAPDLESGYFLEVLKGGSIVQTIKLVGKSYFSIGRLPQCDLYMEHPSLSRLRVGHMMKFGGSTRLVILQGPSEDEEDESELSMTELMALKEEKEKKRKEEEELRKKKEEAEKEAQEERERAKGVSWGMEDEEEEKLPDMEKNPFAELADNESLYIDDPKKMIEKWFDREGYDFDKSLYQVTERGYAHFHCRLDLPSDCQPNFAEAEETKIGYQVYPNQVKGGKKKEAEIKCALEACRILDRLGLLRPSQQTQMERKVKRWEEDDFYASDEDEFMDRTGDIGRKRKMRMKMAGKTEGDTIETYDSLLAKHKKAEEDMVEMEKELKKAMQRKAEAEKRSASGDLDSYLSELKKGAQVDKETVTKLKVRIAELSKEKERLVKLINIARPANMPELKSAEAATVKPKAGIMIGRRPGKGLGMAAKVKSVSADSVSKPVVVKSEEKKVLEAFLEEEESKKVAERERELQPIGYEVVKPKKHEPQKKERMGAGEMASVVIKGPEVPEHVKKALEKARMEEESLRPLEKHTETSEKTVLGTLDVLNAQKIEAVQGDTLEDNDEERKRKRGDRGSKRAKKKKDEDEEEELKDDYYKVGMDRQYDVWMPPSNQDGTGKTSLNEKLGY